MGKTTIQVHISESLSDSVSFDLCSMQYITVLVTPMKATGLMVSGHGHGCMHWCDRGEQYTGNWEH